MQMKRDDELAALSPADLCAEWAKAGKVAKEHADYASKLKTLILQNGFGYRGPTDMRKGTDSRTLPGHRIIKAVFVFDHKLKAAGDELDDRIKQVERLDGGVLAESLFKYGVEISGSAYQGLADDHPARRILSPILEIKSRVHALSYEAMKDGK